MDALPTPGELTLRRLLEPFTAAMALEDTREIVVTRPGSFGVEGDHGWTWHGDDRLTYRWLDALGRLAGRMTHQDLSGASPACSSRLPGGQRITINMPPMMPEGVIQLTIRQRAKSFDPTLDWLEARGWFRWTEGRRMAARRSSRRKAGRNGCAPRSAAGPTSSCSAASAVPRPPAPRR